VTWCGGDRGIGTRNRGCDMTRFFLALMCGRRRRDAGASRRDWVELAEHDRGSTNGDGDKISAPISASEYRGALYNEARARGLESAGSDRFGG